MKYLQPAELIEAIRLTPLVSIDLIVRNPEEAILVGLRTNKPAQNCWFVPGGRICKDERKADAFRRISRAELGLELEIQQARFIGVYEHLYQDNFAGEAGLGTHYVVLAYEVRLAEALTTLPEEQHGAFRWLTVEELLQAADVHDNTKAYFR